MKKIIALLLVAAISISISACGKEAINQVLSAESNVAEQSSPIGLSPLNPNNSGNTTSSNTNSSIITSHEVTHSPMPDVTVIEQIASAPTRDTKSSTILPSTSQPCTSSMPTTSKKSTTSNTSNAPSSSSTESNFKLITPTQPQLSNLSGQIADLINAERVRCGISALRVEPKLTQAAQIRAKETLTNNGHTRANGTTWATVLDDVQYGTLRTSKQSYDDGKTWVDVQEYYSGAGAENLARTAYEPISFPNGFRCTSEEFNQAAHSIFNDWKSSSGHYHNMINSTYKATGIGCTVIVNGNYMSIKCIEIFAEE